MCVSMFRGLYLGFKDDNGIPVRCGDRVRLTRHTGGNLITTMEDGWGRDFKLDKSEYFIESTEIEIIEGTIGYSIDKAAFHIILDGTRNFCSLNRFERKIRKEDKFEVVGNV